MKFNESFATRTVNTRLLDADYGSIIRDAELTKDKATIMSAYTYKSKCTGFNMIHATEGYMRTPRNMTVPITSNVFHGSHAQFNTSYMRNNLFLYATPGTKELIDVATKFDYDKPVHAMEAFGRILIRHTKFESLVMIEQDDETRTVDGLKNYMAENNLSNVYCLYFNGNVMFLYFDTPKTYAIAQALMGSYHYSR